MSLTFDDQNISLVDASGSAMEVRSGNAISALSQSMYLMGGVSGSTATMLKTDSGGSLFVTGSIVASISGTQTVTGTVGVTSIASPVSIGNFPTTQSVKIDQAITLPVSMSNTPTVTGSLFVFNNSSSLLWTTGSHAVFPVGTFAVSLSNGTPVTQSVKIDQSIALPVSVSNSITGSVFTFNNPGTPMWVTGSVTSPPTGTQSITGSVGITSVASPVSIGNFPTTQSVKIDQSVVLTVSMSNTPTVTGSVGVTSIASPVSIANFPVTQSMFLGGVSAGVVQTVTGSLFAFNNLSTPMWTTGSQGIFAIATLPVSISYGGFPVTQSVKIDQTTTLPVSISNSPTITGSVFIFNNQSTPTWVTGALSISSVAPSGTQTVTGSVFTFNNQNTPLWITGSLAASSGTQVITGTVGVTSIAAPVSIGNFPVTQSVKIDQSIVLSTTGSLFAFNNQSTPLWTTGSAGVFAVGTFPVSVSNTPTITGSIFSFNNPGTPMWITGSVTAAPIGVQAVTGTITIASIASPVSTLITSGGNIASVNSFGQLSVSQTPVSSSPGIASGVVTTSAVTNVPIRGTTYTEPAANARRSVSSANAADAAAGTGARQVKITYYDISGSGPSTETITLNGVTPVNTVSTTICYIEDFEVTSVGSGGVNAGILTLFGATAGGGGTVGTIAAGLNQTQWAHHYVAINKSCYITGLAGNNNNASNGSLLTVRAKLLGVATAPEIQASDFLRVGGGTAQPTRTYTSPIKITGPARLILYAAPEGTPSIITRGSFDFYDQ